MHELPVIERISGIVLKHAEQNGVKRVVSVRLLVGELTDLLDEWMQKYFEYCTKDTVAEGARLDIERVPAVTRCSNCGREFQVEKNDLDGLTCPGCGETKNFTLISGTDYFIKEMEAI